jgi:hypothetical protein
MCAASQPNAGVFRGPGGTAGHAVTGVNGGKRQSAPMRSELTREQPAELLREAERAHHNYEQGTGDDDWSGRYAQFLLDRLGDRR